jgi:hypothetical protein
MVSCLVAWLSKLTSVLVLATLAVASIEEDTYGHVQHVLPVILESIVRIRSSILSFQSEALGQATLLGRSQDSAIEGIRGLIQPVVRGELPGDVTVIVH